MAQQIPRLIVQDLTERELLILRHETERRKKSVATTWLLWLFLGVFGAHWYYLGRIRTAIAMLLSLGGFFGVSDIFLIPYFGRFTATLAAIQLTLGVSFVWWIIALFLIPGMLRSNVQKVQDEILHELGALREKDARK